MAEKRKAGTVTGIFDDGGDADRARTLLTECGLTAEEIHVRSPGSLRPKSSAGALVIGLGLGTLLGAIMGGILGWVSTWVAPVVGPVTQDIPMQAVIILFVILGGGAGGTAGALFAMDASGDPAIYLTQEVESGRTLVSATPSRPDDLRRAASALWEAGALDVLSLGISETAERVAG
ncbi:MAG: hypothetical protein J2P39_05390 [Candidatus Dormibacteraeota bacterium]|nr:hypothetical protein [Candidatus Dormibacteraeota bacterium]